MRNASSCAMFYLEFKSKQCVDLNVNHSPSSRYIVRACEHVNFVTEASWRSTCLCPNGIGIAEPCLYKSSSIFQHNHTFELGCTYGRQPQASETPHYRQSVHPAHVSRILCVIPIAEATHYLSSHAVLPIVRFARIEDRNRKADKRNCSGGHELARSDGAGSRSCRNMHTPNMQPRKRR